MILIKCLSDVQNVNVRFNRNLHLMLLAMKLLKVHCLDCSLVITYLTSLVMKVKEVCFQNSKPKVSFQMIEDSFTPRSKKWFIYFGKSTQLIGQTLKCLFLNNCNYNFLNYCYHDNHFIFFTL